MIIIFHLVNMFNNSMHTILSKTLAINTGLIGRCAVSAFFIMAGYFLYHSISNKKIDMKNFIMHRIIRLWPVMAFSFFIMYLLGDFNKYTDTMNLLFLSSSLGVVIGESSNNATWFICVLFFLSIFFKYLIDVLPKDKLIFHCSIISFFSWIFLTHAPENKLIHFKILLPSLQLTSGLLFGLSGLSLGILLAIVFNKFSLANNKNNNLITTILYTVLEIFLFSFYCCHIIYHKPKFSNILYYSIIFAIIFVLFLYQKGWFSKLLNNKFSGILGKYSYSLFVTHVPIIKFGRYHLWNNLPEYQALLITFLLIILTGILTYHLIEQPATKYLTKLYNEAQTRVALERERERVLPLSDV